MTGHDRVKQLKFAAILNLCIALMLRVPARWRHQDRTVRRLREGRA